MGAGGVARRVAARGSDGVGGGLGRDLRELGALFAEGALTKREFKRAKTVLLGARISYVRKSQSCMV